MTYSLNRTPPESSKPETPGVIRLGKNRNADYKNRMLLVLILGRKENKSQLLSHNQRYLY
jgi:hypothetical protein